MKYLLRLFLLRALAMLARPLVRWPARHVDRLLYIKPDHLGDLLLATPVLAALRQRFPDAQITALVGPWSQFVLQRNPDVDRLQICPFPGFTRGAKGPFWQPYVLLLRYALLLRAARYDLVIVGRDDHWWGAALALLAGIPHRIGFAVPTCRPLLSQALPWDPQAHVTAQGLALVEAADQHASAPADSPDSKASSLLRQWRDIPARFDPAQDDRNWALEWLRAQGLPDGALLVVIHPGTGGPSKLWFAERWAEVADALAAAGARVVLTGGPGEEALVNEIAEGMRARPLTLAGRTSVGQLGALMRHAKLTIGVDSGPLHLAAAQGIPTLHLYGPGDAGRFGPWGDSARHVVMRAGVWCSPCGVFDACPRGLTRPECMDQIAVAQVVAQAQRMLATSGRSPAMV